MVNGLVYSVTKTASGKLTRKTSAQMAAPSICSGPGISPQNKPAATAPAAEWRFKCHSLGCSNDDSNGFNQGLLRIVS